MSEERTMVHLATLNLFLASDNGDIYITIADARGARPLWEHSVAQHQGVSLHDYVLRLVRQAENL